MIKFKKLKFSNVFSYGENNEIDLDQAPLTQLVGKNGHGKSSIALILEEGLFNSNSKKIKKSDVLNRYSTSKNYAISVIFDVDGAEYTVNTTRTASSGSVKLTRGGIDISSHTATGTYKQIENILGFDSKTFAQVVYQSSVSSLEFLTATDSARKKFLIDLLNLGKYTKALDVFKELASNSTKQVDTTNAKLLTVQSWLAKYAKEDLAIRDVEPERLPPTKQQERITLLNNDLSNITTTNKKISQNLTYKGILDSIEIDASRTKPIHSDLKEWTLEVSTISQELKEGALLSKKPSTKTIKCPTCSQDMDNSVMFTRVIKFEEKKPELEARLRELNTKISEATAAESAWQAYERKVQEWEKYHSLYDPDMPTELLNADTIKAEIKSLQTEISSIEAEISKQRARNKVVIEHNSKAKVIAAQMKDMQQEAGDLGEELLLRMDEASKLSILVKTFSTTGLVAYKIECLVKDLEELTNEYLSVLAGGRFQLSFVVVSDKLNVVITDNGRDIDILALSSGERARVNIATLLAIRKLMQSLSNSRTNLLILDETVENLDAEGKEKLIEVLLEEESLNTFLISHGFSHPLLEKISVIKENNISRIE